MSVANHIENLKAAIADYMIVIRNPEEYYEEAVETAIDEVARAREKIRELEAELEAEGEEGEG